MNAILEKLRPQGPDTGKPVLARSNRMLADLIRDPAAEATPALVQWLRSQGAGDPAVVDRPKLRPPIKVGPDIPRIDVMVLMDFDTDLAGQPVPEGALASEVYGLTMINPLTSGPAYVRKQVYVGGSNGVSIHAPGTTPCFYAREGAIDVLFDRPTDTVSIDAYPVCETPCPGEMINTTGRPFLEAYDRQGKRIAASYYVGTLPGASAGDGWKTLAVSMPSRTIARVRFSCQADAAQWPNKSYFDNLRYHLVI
ncbi:hypothetical protein [Niveibacterium sp.]|uniref:hypothetical protein n=1 Tax=Niveibacterium sp. TaxID=2017444 RepID=UPI0035B3A2FE